MSRAVLALRRLLHGGPAWLFAALRDRISAVRPAFAPVLAESLVVGFTSDWLFPPEQNRQIAQALLRAGKRASYAELATDLGHDSFLLESEELYALIRGFLERAPAPTLDFAI